MRATLSACLIVRDERERLPAALASVAFCDEVLVVDSGSTDGTQALARGLGARVVEHPWRGFGAQRNVAADHATGDWVLELDADETISPALATEIGAFLATPERHGRVDILALPMRHRFLGRELGAAAQYPNYRTRMFRRGAYRHDEARTVHEGLKPHGATLALGGDMVHDLASSWREAVGDAWRYTALEAAQFHPRTSPGRVLVGLVARPLAKAGYRLVVDGAWRDGWQGWVKVGLDAGSDAVVWGRVLARGDRAPGAHDHFGEVMPAAGPVRVVALATRPAGARVAASWLERAVAAGAGTDSELIAPPRALTAGLAATPPRITAPDADAAAAAAPGAAAVPGGATAPGETDAAGAAGGAWLARPCGSAGPLGVARALMGSAQVRRIDVLLLADRGAGLVHRGLAAQVRGATAPLTPSDDPARAVARLARELR